MIVRKHQLYLSILVCIYIVFLFSGCSSFKPSQYPDVIYNNRTPLVSVAYEYGEIDIIIPLVFPGLKPDELSFEVYAKGDSINPILSVKYQSVPKMRLFLPQGVLETREKNNFIKIIPHHPDFISLKIPFYGIDFGKLNLDPVHIVEQPLTVAGFVKNKMTDDPLGKIDVAIYLKGQLLQKVFSDKTGAYSLTIPGRFKDKNFLRIIAGEKLIFAPFRREINFKSSKDLKVDIGLGPSQNLADLGNLYITKKENVHFRDTPNIGGSTIFLLPKGEPIAVEQVSKGLYYGTIEVSVSSGDLVTMSGWLEREDTELLFFDNLFKNENDKDL